MTFDLMLGAVTTALIAVYLVFALLRPRRKLRRVMTLNS